MAYSKTTWQDLPNQTTPINATNLNNMETGIEDNDKRLNGTSVAGDMIVRSIKSKNLFDKLNIVLNRRIDNTGDYYVDNDYFASRYIKIEPNTTYTISKSATASYNCYALFENDKTFISRSGFYSSTTHTFTTPSNARYLLITDTYTNIDTLQLEEGSTATAYSEHQNLNSIVAAGQNSNGSYIMYEDGTMICRGIITLYNFSIDGSLGSLYRGIYQTDIDFPYPFVDYPVVNINPQSDTDYGYCWIYGLVRTKTQIKRIDLMRPSAGTNLTIPLGYIAIGRWY